MGAKSFLDAALSDTGYYCVFANRKKSKPVQKFYSSTGELLDAAIKLDVDGYDTYFALATFTEDSSRKVDNVHKLCAFFLDLDCGKSKEYPTQAHALKDLHRFCETTSIPKPVIISSGRGIHVYWLLKTPVTLSEWLPVASKLKQVCSEHNLLADSVVTADAARILRIPTTHNHKDSPPKEVRVYGKKLTTIKFEVFKEQIDSIPVKTAPAPVVPVVGDTSGINSALMDALIGNQESSFKDILRKTAKGHGCDQLKIIVKDQKEISEPLWRAGLSIAKFCTEKEEAGHFISKSHPDYTVEDTITKMDGIAGPHLCSSFDSINPNVCPNCPNRGKIRSPITLGSSIKEASKADNIVQVPSALFDSQTYIIPAYPKPYFRGTNGGGYKRTSIDGETEDLLIYHNDIYVTQRIHNEEIGECAVLRLHLPKDGIRDFTIPLSAITSKDEFRKQMSMQGVALTKMDNLMYYITTWINELQHLSSATAAHMQFGWGGDDFEAFILGKMDIRKDSVEFNPATPPPAGLLYAFEPKGTLEGWKEAMEFYNRSGFELHQLVVGSGFGAPLMEFLPISGAMMHLHSDTGFGKTTALYAGMSIWGYPKELVLLEDDTTNVKMHRGEVYHSLPLYIDEVTNESGKVLSGLAYQTVGGMQRGRMKASVNEERKRGRPWKLLSVTTGNTSFIDRVAMYKSTPKAEAQRVLEHRVKEVVFDTKEETDNFAETIMKNYGHAGKIYIQYIMNHVPEIKKLLKSVQKRIDTLAKLKAKNRFWSAFMAATMTGLIIAKRLGLINYDTQKLFQFVLDILSTSKQSIQSLDSSIETHLNDYISKNYSNILSIKSTDDGRINSVIPEATPRGELVARYETDVKKLFLLPKPLKIWCLDQQLDYSNIINQLKTLGGKSVKIRLGKGTNMKLPPTNVWVINFNVPVLAEEPPKDAPPEEAPADVREDKH